MARTGESSETVLRVESISKRFGTHDAVSALSFAVEAGEIYGLLGPNGAGKTTTIGIVATVLAPDDGGVSVCSIDAGPNAESARRLVGLVPQDIGLYPSLTAEENLRLFAHLYDVSLSELDYRVGELLELAGLSERRRDRVEVFSGGMKRRLNLVCGLIHRPRLLLLDEPTVGVDPQSRERIFETIRMQAKRGLSVVYTTHYMEEAERLCDRIGIMDGGQLVAEGSRDELVGRMKAARTATVSFRATPGEALKTLLQQVEARALDDVRFRLESDELERDVQRILAHVATGDNTVRELKWSTPNLEDLFLHLTGRELRD